MANDTQPASVTFRYVRSNFFRVIHIDGGYGGLTPSGGIFFSVYNDRTPTPDETVQLINEDGTLGPELIEKTKVKEGVEREVEACILMNVQTAKAVLVWLEERVKMAEALNKEHQGIISETKK
ncbi:MAG TPA: hypothetical protein VKZ53_27100 [Candidatus Angelobacter sp.]|nr:hypothetical protein [Candidatus Angelobacter sp.]